MSEKRRLKRIQLECLLNVYDDNSVEPIGQVLDIHVEGFLLMHDCYMPPKKLYTLRMDLPEEMLELNHIVFEAECVWSEKEFEPGLYNSGFRFKEPSLKNHKILELLIEKYAKVPH